VAGGGDVPGAPPFTLLFTGVCLREGPHARDHAAPGAAHYPPIPPAADLGLEQHECQLAAVLEDGADAHLGAWAKRAAPAIPHAPVPPGGAGLAGFRDPFVFQRWGAGGGTHPWRLVIGSGHKGGRGCLLAYASADPDPGAPGWVFEGVLCGGEGVAVGRGGEVEATAAEAGAGSPPSAAAALSLDAVDVGEMWECPFIVRLPVVSDSDGGGGACVRAFTLVCVSPYPHRRPRCAGAGTRPTNPPIFWLCEEGEERDGGRVGRSIDLAAAIVGPLRLDLGDTLYAPTTPAAGGGGPGGKGAVMMAWLQELRGPGAAAAAAAEDASASPRGRARDYAGCLSLARELSVRVRGDGTPRLHQAPLAALAGLRVGGGDPAAVWSPGTRLQPGGRPLPIPGAVGDTVDLELVFERPPEAGGEAAADPCCCTGVWLRPRLAAAGDEPGGGSAPDRPTAVALLARWDTTPGRLEVVHVTAITPAGCPDLATVVRRVGGACEGVGGGRAALRVLADRSAVEVFAGTGEALATRVYGCGGGGEDAGDTPPRWSLFSLGGGPAPVPAAAGWAMRAGWE
jgi:sucrose-6-phosphate hydrolase SacC (GH32 family)